MRKTLRILVLAVLLVAAFLPGKAEAASLGDEVSCYWEDEGILHIYGSGETTNFSETVVVPWNSEKESIKEVVVEPGVTGIGDYLFAGCVNLEKVTLPSTLKKIGQHTFDGCTKLTEVAIPTGVESIGAGAFAECTGIENVHIQDLSAWCRIDFGDAYANPLNRSAALCISEKKLYNLTVPADVTQIKDFAFTGLEVTNVSFAGNVTSIGERAFAGSPLKQVTLPGSLTSIGKEAFYLSGITSVVIPSSVRELGIRAFSRCFYLTGAQLFGGNQENEGLSTGTETFSGCTALRNLVIEDGITEVGNACCSGAALNFVYLSKTVNTIRENAFRGCNELVEIEYGDTEAQWNLVQIEAGNDYLKATPVTYTEQKCSHSFSAWVDNGNGTHSGKCSLCGFEAAEEHGHSAWKVTKSPTCKETGQEESYCPDCNYRHVVELPKTNSHSYKNDCDKDCDECGAVRDASHVYSNSCDEMCDNCFEKRQVEHSWNEGVVDSEPSCVVNGVIFYQCTSCGQGKTEYPPALSHDYEEEIISDGDCLNGKLIRYTCKRCPHQYTKTVSLPHDFTILESTQASTCTTKGWQTYRCERCSATEIRYLDLDPQNHTYSQVCDSSCDECGATRQVNHSFYSNWQYDQQSHWQECSVCHTKEDTAAHVPGPAATEKTGQHCTVCNYMLQSPLGHIHDLDGSFTGDATGHWMSCKTCKEKVEPKNHSYTGACDDLCDACGYRRQTNHMVNIGWAHNETHHWNYCISCKKTGKEQPHGDDGNGYCSVCGFKSASKEEPTKPKWESDENHHWGADGEKLEHNWDSGTVVKIPGQTQAAEMLYTCVDCGAQRLEKVTDAPGDQPTESEPTETTQPENTGSADATEPEGTEVGSGSNGTEPDGTEEGSGSNGTEPTGTVPSGTDSETDRQNPDSSIWVVLALAVLAATGATAICWKKKK